MIERHELREMWDGYSPAETAPKPKPENKPAIEQKPEPEPAPVAEEPARRSRKNDAEESAPSLLRDLSLQSIADTFRTVAAQAREDKKKFEETLSALQELVTKCQSAGLTQVGVQQAGFDTLRDLKLIKDGSSNETPDAHYALMSIDDVRILVRVLPDKIVDCYNENINKPASQPRYLDNSAFWDGADRDGQRLFRRFDLSKETDQTKLVEAIIITAANTGALQGLRQYDAPAKTAQPLAKPRSPK